MRYDAKEINSLLGMVLLHDSRVRPPGLEPGTGRV